MQFMKIAFQIKWVWLMVVPIEWRDWWQVIKTCIYDSLHRKLSFDTLQVLLWGDDDALLRHIKYCCGRWVWSLCGPRCHMNTCFMIPEIESFHLIPTRPTLGWRWRAVARHQIWVWSLCDPRCRMNTFLWFLTSRAFVWYLTWLILLNA